MQGWQYCFALHTPDRLFRLLVFIDVSTSLAQAVDHAPTDKSSFFGERQFFEGDRQSHHQGGCGTELGTAAEYDRGGADETHHVRAGEHVGAEVCRYYCRIVL